MVDDGDKDESLLRVIAMLEAAANGQGRVTLENIPDNATLAKLQQAAVAVVERLEKEKQRSRTQRIEIEDLLATVEMQRATIMEIATPVIEVAEGVLCLPITGSIGETQGNTILDNLLATVIARQAHEVIVDVTGVHMMGAPTGQWLVRVAHTVRLLGAECTVSGIQPELAKILAESMLELTGVKTMARLRDALERGRERKHDGAKLSPTIKTSR